MQVIHFDTPQWTQNRGYDSHKYTCQSPMGQECLEHGVKTGSLGSWVVLRANSNDPARCTCQANHKAKIFPFSNLTSKSRKGYCGFSEKDFKENYLTSKLL